MKTNKKRSFLFLFLCLVFLAFISSTFTGCNAFKAKGGQVQEQTSKQDDKYGIIPLTKASVERTPIQIKSVLYVKERVNLRKSPNAKSKVLVKIPTGTVFDRDALQQLRNSLPESVVVVLDEAYVDFVDPAQRLDSIELIQQEDDGPPLVSLRTFSKAYGLAGLRLGFGVMSAELATMLHRVRQPFNINSPAQVGALAALEDSEHYERTVNGTRSGMSFLQEAVCKLGCSCHPSQANFFLIDVGGDANQLYEAMLYKGVIVRSMNAYGYPSCIRITVGTEEENQRFVTALGECLRELHYV